MCHKVIKMVLRLHLPAGEGAGGRDLAVDEEYIAAECEDEEAEGYSGELKLQSFSLWSGVH